MSWRLREHGRGRQRKLQDLGRALDHTKRGASADVRHQSTLPDAAEPHSAKDVERVTEKLKIFRKLVAILTRKATDLEQKNMQLEERSFAQTQRVDEKTGAQRERTLLLRQHAERGTACEKE